MATESSSKDETFQGFPKLETHALGTSLMAGLRLRGVECEGGGTSAEEIEATSCAAVGVLDPLVAPNEKQERETCQLKLDLCAGDEPCQLKLGW